MNEAVEMGVWTFILVIVSLGLGALIIAILTLDVENYRQETEMTINTGDYQRERAEARMRAREAQQRALADAAQPRYTAVMGGGGAGYQMGGRAAYIATTTHPRYRFKNKYGSINFEDSKLPGCCGVCVIHRVTFHNVVNKKKLYETFQQYLNRASGEDGRNMHRATFLMSDAVRDNSRASVYDFCTEMGWKQGVQEHNHLSGNQVTTFTNTRG